MQRKIEFQKRGNGRVYGESQLEKKFSSFLARNVKMDKSVFINIGQSCKSLSLNHQDQYIIKYFLVGMKFIRVIEQEEHRGRSDMFELISFNKMIEVVTQFEQDVDYYLSIPLQEEMSRFAFMVCRSIGMLLLKRDSFVEIKDILDQIGVDHPDMETHVNNNNLYNIMRCLLALGLADHF